MNRIACFVVALTAVSVIAGCGKKSEEYTELPPEQILTGNIILAPQQSTAEVQNLTQTMTLPAGQAPAAVLQEPTTLELTSTAPEKPTDKDIQTALKNAGLYNGPIDGNIGPKSQKAIKVFQEQNGLTVDGKVGPRTWKKLSSYLYSAPAESGVAN